MATSVCWDRIHQLPIYDPNVMKSCEYIDSSIYVQDYNVFYTPLLRFKKMTSSDKDVVVEIFLDYISVPMRGSAIGFSTSPSIIDCRDEVINVVFSKEELTQYLKESIAKDIYIWEIEEFKNKVIMGIRHLVWRLTLEKNLVVLNTHTTHVLSSGDGVIINDKTKALAGKFSGLVIEHVVNQETSTKNKIKMIIKIPNMKFNERYNLKSDCILTYTDKKHNLLLSCEMSKLSYNGEVYVADANAFKITRCVSGQDFKIPNEPIIDIYTKKLILPRNKFENRLLTLEDDNEILTVDLVGALSQKAVERFKRLV